MKIISLTQNKITKISDHRFDFLNQWKWSAEKRKNGKWYVIRKEVIRGKTKTIYMHSQITNCPRGFEVDHVDNDGLNNLDENLRICTRTQNSMNKGLQINNTSGYKGVTWDKSRNNWLAQLKHKGKHILSKRFTNPEDAAKEYDKVAEAVYGEFVLTNKSLGLY